MRTPGYAISTGVFSEKDVLLIYLLSLSRDKKSVSLTLKQRQQDGQRVTIQPFERCRVKD